ncbi:nucleotide exchange factor GrpE [Glaciihabitans sp. GrIS 2.15]|uniref:nucleotide exchange factor GrpE n=1 Tax=Glaciihabitans sp. GrIS 2.15 TaxID=3071710 RepID=UPI002DFE6B08|nr:molecular chaperone GrpE [Glaciihabitans sp. GrIS 2.15]
MAANKNPKPGKGKGDPEEPDNGASSEGFEGPDVETSFSDDDLAFLAGDSAAAANSQAPKDPAAEILGDLKRVQAEFANYRKRVERDREANREANIAEVVKSLLPVFDDLSLAEAHGDLAEGPMVVIVAKLRASLEKFGLTVVGEKGDVFDPHQHEALVQLPTPGVTVNTVADVIAPGYKLGERLLRPAKVAVAVPAE